MLRRMQPSVRNLVLANLLTLALALAFGWDAGWLIWPYWIQSVVIGWYARRRMLEVDRFSTEGFTSNGTRVAEDETGKRSTANFFSLHYGFFHAGYLVFLLTRHPVHGLWDTLAMIACGFSFVWSQRLTYAVQHAADLRGRPNLGALMFLPYLRIVPIHLIILVGGLGGGAMALIVFTALKTAADVGLDVIDRRMAIASSAQAVQAEAQASDP